MNLGIHDCPHCRCGLPRCTECGYVLPDHDESLCSPITTWCSRSPIVRMLKADEKKRGVYNPEDWK